MHKKTEKIVGIVFLLLGSIAVVSVLAITLYMFLKGTPAFMEVGVSELLFGNVWKPTAADPSYGIWYIILSSIVGTFGAVIIGVPIGILTAVFLTDFTSESAVGRKVSKALTSAVELLAAIPSVIYGLIGMMILNPLMYRIETAIFAGDNNHQFTGGSNLLSAIIVLAIMILPTVINISASSIKAVPGSIRSASLALGASKIQTIFKVVLPAAKSGIMAGDIDNTTNAAPYKELEPFVKRIREQHNDILSAAKSRQDFTANVSHELKTPITAISGYAELIENKMVDEEQQIKFAGEIRKHSDRLVSLVNDIIRLSELDHKESISEFSKNDIYEIAEERVELLKNNAREKNVQVNLSGEHCIVMSNRGLLIELLDNLIQNAIRYNVQNGSVDVCVKQNGNQTELIVSDTGIGISAHDRDRVFERFYRVDKSRSRETGGTGLGLAIVKHIVELHDGEIFIDSKENKGTSFRVIL